MRPDTYNASLLKRIL